MTNEIQLSAYGRKILKQKIAELKLAIESAKKDATIHNRRARRDIIAAELTMLLEELVKYGDIAPLPPDMEKQRIDYRNKLLKIVKKEIESSA